MAKRTSKRSAKATPGKSGTERVGEGAAKPRKAAPASSKSNRRGPDDVAGPVGPRLLSGGNPQIAKGDGDAPVRAYIAAMPGWKRGVGQRLDALIEQAVPAVRKAVKWNSPLYGSAREEDKGYWFLGVHCFAKYVKVAFFRGALLKPLPPGESKQKDVRYLNIHEDGQFDERRFVAWVKQASRLPGEKM